MTFRRACCLSATLLGGLGLSSAGLAAQTVDSGWSAALYVQQSWPKQTETNRQIREINDTFGAGFKTWDQVANLNVGLQVFRQVHPLWKLGLQLDYSRGRIQGSQVVDTLAGAAALEFEQKYSTYADVLAVAQVFPLGQEGRWLPFLLAGAGMAYERDTTRLTLKNTFLEESLAVDNSGWFPVFSLGGGVDVTFTGNRAWYLELGASYSWARLKHSVPARGSLAPGPTVTADTDSTGPNLWVGLGHRF